MGNFASKLADKLQTLGVKPILEPFMEPGDDLFGDETRVIKDLFTDLGSSNDFKTVFGPVSTRIKEYSGSKPGTRNREFFLDTDTIYLELRFLLETTDLGLKSSVRLKVWGSPRDLICTDGEIGVLARLVARVEDLVADKTAKRLAAMSTVSKA